MDIQEQIWAMTDTNTIKTIVAIYEVGESDEQGNKCS